MVYILIFSHVFFFCDSLVDWCIVLFIFVVEYDDNGKVIKRKSSKLGGNLLQRDTRKIVKKPKLRVGAAVVSDEETEIENLSSNVIVSVPIATPAPKVAVNQELSQITPVQVSDKISSLWDQLKSGSANPTPSPPPNVEISTPSVKISGKPKLDFSRKTGTVASVTPVAVTTVKFAGENLQVPTDAPKPVKIGIDAALEELATKKSISTLTKSKLDWENDKTVQGDAFELAQHRKDG